MTVNIIDAFLVAAIIYNQKILSSGQEDNFCFRFMGCNVVSQFPIYIVSCPLLSVIINYITGLEWLMSIYLHTYVCLTSVVIVCWLSIDLDPVCQSNNLSWPKMFILCTTIVAISHFFGQCYVVWHKVSTFGVNQIILCQFILKSFLHGKMLLLHLSIQHYVSISSLFFVLSKLNSTVGTCMAQIFVLRTETIIGLTNPPPISVSAIMSAVVQYSLYSVLSFRFLRSPVFFNQRCIWPAYSVFKSNVMCVCEMSYGWKCGWGISVLGVDRYMDYNYSISRDRDSAHGVTANQTYIRVWVTLLENV